MEIPTALIHEIQLALRRGAGVPSYDPSDPLLAPLPSLRDALSGLDPSLPADHRCGRCRGGLIRGPESTLCIFCGADRRGEAPPLALSFASTEGCRKLLESLNLDGSEVVTLDPESSDANSSQDVPKEGLILSDLLDVQFRWPIEKEKNDNNTVASLRSYASDLSKDDSHRQPLEKEKTDTSSTSNVHLDLSKDDSYGHTLEKDNIDTSSRSNEPPQSAYALRLSGVDLDSFFSDSKSASDTRTRKEAISAAASSSPEDLTPKNQTSTGNQVSSVLETPDFFEHFQSSSMELSSSDIKGGEFGDSFADWAASGETSTVESKAVDLFQGLSTSEFAAFAPPKTTFSQQTDIGHELDFKDNSEKLNKVEGQLSSSGDWIEDDLWSQINIVKTDDHLKSGRETNSAELKNDLKYTASESDTWVQDKHWPTTVTQGEGKTESTNDNDESFDDWQDFTSSNKAPGGLSVSGAQSGTEASSTAEFNNMKNVDYNDDLHDPWQEFTSMGGAPKGLSNTYAETGSEIKSLEHASGTKSVDLEDMEFGSFVNSNSFFGASDGKKGSGEVNSFQLDPSVSNRNDEIKGVNKMASSSQGVQNVGENSVAFPNMESSSPTVENLLSQMHDLSFMLNSSLSIPKKDDDSAGLYL